MSHELLEHIKHCSHCPTLLKHASGVRLLAHLIESKFTHSDAVRAVNWIYQQIDQKLRKTEAL